MSMCFAGVPPPAAAWLRPMAGLAQKEAVLVLAAIHGLLGGHEEAAVARGRVAALDATSGAVTAKLLKNLLHVFSRVPALVIGLHGFQHFNKDNQTGGDLWRERLVGKETTTKVRDNGEREKDRSI